MKYKRILLKLSGEALSGQNGNGIDYDTLVRYASIVCRLTEKGHELGIVTGGGNFWRGRSSGSMDRVAADKVGMLATVMNSVALADALESQGLDCRLMTAVFMPSVGEAMDGQKARRHLEEGRVVIFAGGTGNPFFSTDSAAALRAAETGCDLILKSTLVDGVYDKNPHEYDDARLLHELSFSQILEEKLDVVDATAAALCRAFGLKLKVINGNDPENIIRAAAGEAIGSLVSEER
ncbi:MAG TPA: UMP kinase [Clostridiaceae bacterium]|nr:UMP kinase [Clostridiaceae bacterium]